MLQVQHYLSGGGTLETLAREYAIKNARHATLPNLVLLRYDQINSPMHEPLVQECRTLILDEGDGWRIVGRGLNKFFNYGEPNAAEIDWTTARVQEKVDGTLCLFYYYEEWRVATSGFPDARGRAQDLPITFHELIWQTANAAGLRFHSPAHSYLFELTSPHTRVVVPHTETALTLLAIRHNETGAWLPTEETENYLEGEVRRLREYPLRSFPEILATFDAINPLKQEGYVVVDGAGRRVKVKHPKYVAIHLLKAEATPKRFVEVLRQGEEWELLAYFPELAAAFAPIRAAYETLCAAIERDYARLKAIPEQKAFAAEAIRTPYPFVLFALRGGQCYSAREYLAKRAHLSAVLRLLGVDAGAEESAAP